MSLERIFSPLEVGSEYLAYLAFRNGGLKKAILEVVVAIFLHFGPSLLMYNRFCLLISQLLKEGEAWKDIFINLGPITCLCHSVLKNCL